MELFQQFSEVVPGESPLEGRGDGLVVLLETQQAVSDRFERGEVVRRQDPSDPDLRFLLRLRFHLSALFGEYLRKKKERSAWAQHLTSNVRCDAFWSAGWPIIVDIVADQFKQAEEMGVTTFSFVRAADSWSKMIGRLGIRLKVQAKRA